MTTSKRYKILVSCYACSPYKGSEPGMGWKFIKGLSEYHDVHVISEKEKWKKDIEKLFSEQPSLASNLTFHFIPKRRNRTLRKIWPPSYYWYYNEWQKKVYKLALQLDEQENFDLIHQLNMVGFREPGYLWKIDKPFVWGPIGGMEITPWKFLPIMGLYGGIYYLGRNIYNICQRRFLKRPQKAANRKNNQLIAATPGNKKYINEIWGEDAEVISEVGTLDKSNSRKGNKRSPQSPIEIVWSGKHIPGKALNLLLQAIAKIDPDTYKLNILGDGPHNSKWKRLAEKLNINSNIYWHGWKKMEEAHSIMSKGHLFIITSLKDLTSTVTLEALSLGLPIVCLDHCGFAEVVDDSCGIKVPVTSPPEVISNFATAIKKMYRNENYRQELSKGALKRAEQYSWDKKIAKLNAIYNDLIDGRK